MIEDAITVPLGYPPPDSEGQGATVGNGGAERA
jgi:hypothetical protein